MSSDDLYDFAVLAAFLLCIVLVTVAIILTGSMLTMWMHGLGAREYPASWLAYGCSFLVWVIGFLCVAGRIVNKRWPWK